MIRKIRNGLIQFTIKILERLLRDKFAQISDPYVLICEGKLDFPLKYSIGVGSNIIIPKYSELCLGEGVYIGRHVEIGPNQKIEIGDYTSIQDRTIILGDVSIGRYCTFASNIYISSGNHYFDKFPELNIKDQDVRVIQNLELGKKHSKPVVIEDDCWLGANVFVMNGIKIGKGSVIGANAVITKDILPYSVVAGVPAKKIRNRINFIPPSYLYYNRTEDLPYFYSGFLVSDLEKDRYVKFYGLATKKHFSIALNSKPGDVVVVRCKKIVSDRVWIIHNNFKYELTDEYTENHFYLENADFRINFSVEQVENQTIISSLPSIVVESCFIKT
ncbi:acyltransferase [Leptospira terpstrae]|uniref:Transferase hexapeptide repeat protein n=1 Tax=Leptospira terpstrae serovar Hualin str. LT 11-33 = ATCC 700639 TaxID=1257025 RepID=N1VPP9_9LEPT|nr:DapH/DapD/GlmU-related protein [Leptospira terpstrae]EMY61699.1 transferase hexapeptide repeat protein [Leptospira terpstrae serovar Hualin str. LT 11-33 = ATCC 700639]